VFSLTFLGVLLLLNIPVYWVLGRFFFPYEGEFTDAVVRAAEPDWLDWLRAPFLSWEQRWADSKHFFYWAILAFTILSEYYFVYTHWPQAIDWFSAKGWP
jgi:uncharacterized protein involved in cysteine biosynthesis